MTDARDTSSMLIGRMEGRLSALESRIDRHESFVTQKLALIDEKLDRALLVQAQGTAIARTLHWGVGALLSLGAWFVGRYGAPGGGH
jgi:hypothetical protein